MVSPLFMDFMMGVKVLAGFKVTSKCLASCFTEELENNFSCNFLKENIIEFCDGILLEIFILLCVEFKSL